MPSISKIKVTSLAEKKYISQRKGVFLMLSKNFYKKSFNELYAEIKDKKERTEFFSIMHGVDWKAPTQNNLLHIFKLIFKKWDISACITISKSDAKNTKLPVHTSSKSPSAIQIRYTGPYQKISMAYLEITRYSKEKKLELEDYNYELYLNDPDQVAPEKLQTLISVPIKKAAPKKKAAGNKRIVAKKTSKTNKKKSPPKSAGASSSKDKKISRTSQSKSKTSKKIATTNRAKKSTKKTPTKKAK